MRTLIVLVATLMIAGCKKNEQPAAQSEPNTSSRQEEQPVTEPAPPTATAEEERDLAKQMNGFALALHQRASGEGNACLSPFSVASALALLELGAKSETEAALVRAIAGDAVPSEFSRTLGALARAVSGSGELVEQMGEQIQPHLLRSANSLWIAKAYPVAPEFLAAAKKYYAATAATIDVALPKQSAEAINGWVKDNTGGKIENIISPSMIHGLTRMVLVNAVHFVGRWRDPFYEESTAAGVFWAGGATEVQAPMMKQLHYYGYVADDMVEVVELPYWGTNEAELAMLVVLPRKRDGLSEVEATLNAEVLESWTSSLRHEMVDLSLPKWKTEWGGELSKVLAELGLAELFSGAANLSGISAEDGLKVDAVVHKTFISVDEKGTEAAAATAILASGTGMPPKPIEVRVDHPFFYVIRDKVSGVILFTGRVDDPSR